MKIGPAIRLVRSGEVRLAGELSRIGERHKTDHEVYHLTRTLANMSRRHVENLSRFGGRYPGEGRGGSRIGAGEGLRGHRTASAVGGSAAA